MLRWLAALALLASALLASALVVPARADLAGLIADCGTGYDWVKSTRACVRLIEEEKPDEATRQMAYARLAQFQMRMGDFSSAQSFYADALKLWPSEARYLIGSAGALNGLKKYDLAIKAATAAIKSDGGAAAAYDERGKAYLGKGQPAKALPDFRKAFELDGADVFVAANVGFALSDLGRDDEALPFFTRALVIEEDWADALVMRGKVRLRMGRPDLAIADCKRAGDLSSVSYKVRTECPGIVAAAAAAPSRPATPSGPEVARTVPEPAPAPAPTPVVAPPAPAEKPATAPATLRRIALVIGNSTYENVNSLRNPGPDATAIAAKLKSKGFEVTLEQDVSRRKLLSTISAFLSSIDKKTQVVVYYAGHGVELDGANFIVPTDMPAFSPDAEELIKDHSVNLSTLLVEISRRDAAATVVILDACRDNPFRSVKIAGLTRSLRAKDGLAPVAAPSGVFVMYSAGVNQEALDRLSYEDPDPNGLFTRRLLPLMDATGLELRTMAIRLRSEVSTLAKTSRLTDPNGHDQSPATYDQMNGEFYFTPPEGG